MRVGVTGGIGFIGRWLSEDDYLRQRALDKAIKADLAAKEAEVGDWGKSQLRRADKS